MRVSEIAVPIVRAGVGELHELLRVGHRQHAQYDGIQQAENGRVGADPQRQGKHRRRGKARTAPEYTKRVAEILQGDFDGGQPAGFAIDFLGAGDAAKAAQRRGAGFAGSQSAAQAFLDFRLQVKLHLVFQIPFQAPAAEEAENPVQQYAQLVHRLCSF